MTARIRLLIISFSTLVSDPRVQKQIALFSPHYDVVTCGYGPRPDGVAQHEQIPDNHVVWQYPRIRVMLRQYRNAYRHNPAVAWALQRLVPGDFDVILANDVDSAGVAAALKPVGGFHVDLHEYAPLQNTELLRFRLFVAPFLSWQIKKFVSHAKSTSTVCDSLAKKYEQVFGLKPAVVMNAPPFSDFEQTPVGNPIRLVHAGAALRNRNLEVLIDGVMRTGTKFTLDFYLAANDAEYLSSLKARASSASNIVFHEPVPFTELVRTLNAYDIGLHVLAPTNFNNANALPNKFFEYVQARIGLIIGPSPEMAKILGQHDFGAVTGDFSAESLANTLAQVDERTVARWKENADRSAAELSAETQTPVWDAAITALAHGLGPAR